MEFLSIGSVWFMLSLSSTYKCLLLRGGERRSRGRGGKSFSSPSRKEEVEKKGREGEDEEEESFSSGQKTSINQMHLSVFLSAWKKENNWSELFKCSCWWNVSLNNTHTHTHTHTPTHTKSLSAVFVAQSIWVSFPLILYPLHPSCLITAWQTDGVCVCACVGVKCWEKPEEINSHQKRENKNEFRVNEECDRKKERWRDEKSGREEEGDVCVAWRQKNSCCRWKKHTHQRLDEDNQHVCLFERRCS